MTTQIAMPPRARLGPCTATPPAIRAGRLTLPAPAQCWSSAAPPDVSCTLAWQGGGYGLNPPVAQTAQVTLTHCVSDPAAFDRITGQLYADGAPAGDPVTLTPSQTMITETVSSGTAEITAGSMPTLQLRVSWHQTAPGFASVSWSRALTPAYTPPAGSSSALLLLGII
jgi:hypothetical protein